MAEMTALRGLRGATGSSIPQPPPFTDAREVESWAAAVIEYITTHLVGRADDSRIEALKLRAFNISALAQSGDPSAAVQARTLDMELAQLVNSLNTDVVPGSNGSPNGAAPSWWEQRPTWQKGAIIGGGVLLVVGVGYAIWGR